ncbi:ESX secretion-associated protein EspG, partial [Crossiella equi]
PARGQSFNLPADAFGEQPRGRHSRGAEEDNGGGFLQSSGGSSGGATPHRLRELMAKPRLAAGQLFTASRDRLGARRRSAAGLTFFDVAEGRYMAAKTPGPDGQDWVFVAPADPRAMAQKLTEMASGPTR